MEKIFVYSVSEFNEIVTSGRNELKDTFNNPFVIINALNKAARRFFKD